jgi:hypothetical protein
MGGFLIVGALALLTLRNPVQAQGEKQDENFRSEDHNVAHHPKITSFAVETTDETLTYPSYLVDLPDEHTTIIPPPAWPYLWETTGADTYLVFASSNVYGGTAMSGAVVLETTDLMHFYPATDWGYSHQVMGSPLAISDCDPAYDTEFDENYAAPGSVVQDPTRPPGNLIMIYEAENHCPSGIHEHHFYATVGFARSSDNGRTWPLPPKNAEFGNADRHPILKQFGPEPAAVNEPMGDALPSAFVDINDKGEAYLYVTYGHAERPGEPNPGGWLIRVARAKLGEVYHSSGDPHRRDPDQNGQLHFFKWYNSASSQPAIAGLDVMGRVSQGAAAGAFSQPGIAGFDSGVIPTGGCAGRQVMPEITYNDDLGLYFMIFVGNLCAEGHTAWYYSTATSLDHEDWTPPQMIANSEHPMSTPCNLNDYTDTSLPGFYPSFMSPGSAAGHTKLRGRAFFLLGCDDALPRALASRTFTITTEP